MKITTDNAYAVLMNRIQCMRDINAEHQIQITWLSSTLDECCSSSQSSSSLISSSSSLSSSSSYPSSSSLPLSSSSSAPSLLPCGIIDENDTDLLGDENGQYTIDEACDDSIENAYEITEDYKFIIQEDGFNYQLLESWNE